MSLDDVNDHLNTELKSEDYDSLGGILLSNTLIVFRRTGDEVNHGGWHPASLLRNWIRTV